MAVVTNTGGLGAGAVTTVPLAAWDSPEPPYYRFVTVTNENGSATIAVAWGSPTVADPPASLDGQARDNMLFLPAIAGNSQTFKIEGIGPAEIKLRSPGTPRYIVSVFDKLM